MTRCNPIQIVLTPGSPLHNVQRGHDRGACLVGEDDHLAYRHRLGEALKPTGVQGWPDTVPPGPDLRYSSDRDAAIVKCDHKHSRKEEGKQQLAQDPQTPVRRRLDVKAMLPAGGGPEFLTVSLVDPGDHDHFDAQGVCSLPAPDLLLGDSGISVEEFLQHWRAGVPGLDGVARIYGQALHR